MKFFFFLVLNLVVLLATCQDTRWHESCTSSSECAAAESGVARVCTNALNPSSSQRTCENPSGGSELSAEFVTVILLLAFSL